MTQVIGRDNYSLILGLGATGLSFARHLAARGLPFGAADSRREPPGLAEFRRRWPQAPVHCGPLEEAPLSAANRLLVSPGVPLAQPAIKAAREAGVEIQGDIDLFRAEARAPVVAITGSNGKSTVTSLVGEMAARAGWKAAVGGNLGTPALDLLEQADPDIYVLEISSFQLEAVDSLQARVACLLNLSPDHLDRYPSLAAYHAAKQRVYRGCATAVWNAEETLTQPLLPAQVPQVRFGLGIPDLGDWGVKPLDGDPWLVRGLDAVMPQRCLRLKGRHNLANALAALALGEAAGIPRAAMVKALEDFVGLPHRCQWVRSLDGVDYINDSKATNPGAALAALEGLAEAGPLVLIAGGEGKGADFSALTAPLARYGRALVVMGRDAEQVAAVAPETLPVARAADMAEAVSRARELARPGDAVLLAPACASLDQYADFAARGASFVAAVEALS